MPASVELMSQSATRKLNLEKQVAELRGAESAIEQDRQNQVQASEGFNSSQANYYKLGADVSRIEQQIRHTRESREQQSNELQQLERSLKEARDHIDADKKRIEEIDIAMKDDKPAYEQLQADQKISGEMLVQAEQKQKEWQARWGEHSRRESEHTQTAHVELSRMDQLERGIAQSTKRIERLQLELDSIGIADLTARIEDSIAEEVSVSEEESRLAKSLESSVSDLQQIRLSLIHI